LKYYIMVIITREPGKPGSGYAPVCGLRSVD
jgi:hypothetical protein